MQHKPPQTRYSTGIRTAGFTTEAPTGWAALNGQYTALKEEVREAEIVKRNVERLMRGSKPRKEKNLSRGMER